MATPEELRTAIAELVRRANGDLAELWRLASASEIAEALYDVLPALIDTYGIAASAIAADWYDDARAAKGVGGRFSAIAADIPNPGAQPLVAWALERSTSDEGFRGLIEGGMQRRIANFSRKSLMESSVADPRSKGWMRVGIGECEFCRMLISRGAVYTEATVRFGAHDSCRCQCAPVWGGDADVFDVEEYRRSLRNRSDSTRSSDNARAREWIEQNL